MMLYPPVADLVDKVGSRYQLVNVVAQRAVSIAIDEVYAGKLTVNNKPSDAKSADGANA